MASERIAPDVFQIGSMNHLQGGKVTGRALVDRAFKMLHFKGDKLLSETLGTTVAQGLPN
jgi:hypothetical protein